MTDDTVRSDALREALDDLRRTITSGGLYLSPANRDRLLEKVDAVALAAPAAEPRRDGPTGVDEQTGVRLAEFLSDHAYLRCLSAEPEYAGEVATDILRFLGLNPTVAYRAAAQPGPSGPGLARRLALALHEVYMVTAGQGSPVDPILDRVREDVKKALAAADSAPGEGLMDVLLARLVCDDDEEPCDADGRGPHTITSGGLYLSPANRDRLLEKVDAVALAAPAAEPREALQDKRIRAKVCRFCGGTVLAPELHAHVRDEHPDQVLPETHDHAWVDRQQVAGRYCPGCDTMEWFDSVPGELDEHMPRVEEDYGGWIVVCSANGCPARDYDWWEVHRAGR